MHDSIVPSVGAVHSAEGALLPKPEQWEGRQGGLATRTFDLAFECCNYSTSVLEEKEEKESLTVKEAHSRQRGKGQW